MKTLAVFLLMSGLAIGATDWGQPTIDPAMSPTPSHTVYQHVSFQDDIPPAPSASGASTTSPVAPFQSTTSAPVVSYQQVCGSRGCRLLPILGRRRLNVAPSTCCQTVIETRCAPMVLEQSGQLAVRMGLIERIQHRRSAVRAARLLAPTHRMLPLFRLATCGG